MAKIVILGAGLGGVCMAYEMKALARPGDEVLVVNDGEYFEFTPSNPWVAVGWRRPDQIMVHLPPVFDRCGIGFEGTAAARVLPGEKAVDLADGRRVDYDFLVIATGPELAFDEVPGLGPGGHTESVCRTGHADGSRERWQAFVDAPGPIVVGAAAGASCYGPAYEYAFIADTDLKRRRIRDRVPMTFVTPEPYVGHLGLDGVGDTRSLMESELRDRHIHWMTNTRIDRVEAGRMFVTRLGERGETIEEAELPFAHAMVLPAFRGVAAVRGVEGLVNPRGFVIVDEHQRNPAYPEVYSVGVCVAIPPMGPTPLPVGVPKTGYMIESMVTATAHNIRAVLDGRAPSERATWNALCLADFGDSGVAFVAKPQIPPRNLNWAARGRWVHLAKIAFEKYFLRKVRKGVSEPIYEKVFLEFIGLKKLRGE